MKIGVIGTRGIPDIQGGIETHCQELYTRLAEIKGNHVTIYRRKPYLDIEKKNVRLKNIRFIDISVPQNKSLETFLHSLLSSIHALFQKYDIVHYHNTGPGFFIPIIKLSRAKVVFTYHNVSYTQRKWNKFARQFLTISEKISLTWSDYIIFISDVIRSEMKERYKISSNSSKIVFNGVKIPEKPSESAYLKELGLEEKGYILSVGRFMEEKGFDYLIRAYKATEINGIKLVLAGDTDYPTDYSRKLKKMAMENGIILTGFIKGEKLKQLYSYARLFIISSYSEGLPIALLEAMSYDLDVLASDIPANSEIKLDKNDYFRTGDEKALKNAILMKLETTNQRSFRPLLTEKYNWDRIAEETNEIYKTLIS
jgi:glycosyltransferase involved in cell wall biosynthesis